MSMVVQVQVVVNLEILAIILFSPNFVSVARHRKNKSMNSYIEVILPVTKLKIIFASIMQI